jgi:NADPH:quinone reductase-like Zn-dependent oxidoreductase
MKALVANQYGPPEETALADIERPAPGRGQVLLRVEAVGVNPADFKLLTGEHRDVWPQRFPFVPGMDVAGTVETVGEGAAGFVPGDRVFGMLYPTLGGFAEYALASGESTLLARRPEGLDPVRAAALPTVGLTAGVLVGRAALRPGEVALAIGASGGVGSLGVQLAAQAGARVLATARPEHAAYVRGLGATETIDNSSEDVVADALRLHPAGTDVLLDMAGLGAGLLRTAGAIRDGGRIVSVLSAPEPAAFGRGLSVDTIYVDRAEPGQLEALGRRVAGGSLTVEVSATYRLDQAARAVADVHRTHKRGKLVVTLT